MSEEELYRASYLQDPFEITDDELNKLEKHCEKTLKYERFNNEHSLVLALIYKYRDSIPKQTIRDKIKQIEKELDEKYSAEKISVFSGNTYMEKFKLIGKQEILKELLDD